MINRIFRFAFTLVLVTGVAIAQPASVATNKGYNIGDAVNDFKLVNIDGRHMSMSDFPDQKGFILVFTCNHCPYSIAYEDRIDNLNKKYAAKGFKLIAINPNDPDIVREDSYEAMKKRADEKKFSFPYLFDDGQHVMRKFGVVRTPQVFIVSAKGDNNYRLEYNGAIDDNYEDSKAVKNKYVEKVVDALLAGKTPPFTQTKAIGCRVKVKE